MADNPQPPKAKPPLPSSGMTGRVKAPTTKLPPLQAGATGKIVVMLSSIAKTPVNSQQLLPAPGSAPVTTPPNNAAQIVRQPPPLPAKKVMPAATPLPPAERLSSTTFVKLPPKTAAPAFVSLSPKPTIVTDKKEPAKVAPPLLPAKHSGPVKSEPPKPDPKKTGPIVLNAGAQAPPAPAKSDLKKTGLIKLNPAAADSAPPDESIFAKVPEPTAPPVPEGWKRLETGELPLPKGGLKAADPFEHSRRLDPKPSPVPPVAVPVVREKPTAPPVLEAKDTPHVAPPLAHPRSTENPSGATKGEPTLNPAPVALAPAHPVNVAPPLVEKGHEEPPERLPQPHLPEPSKSASALDDSSLRALEAPITKAPALVEPEKVSAKPPPLPPAKSKDAEKEKLKTSAPLVLTSTSRIFVPSLGEGKPALRPAVLPTRATRSLGEPPAAPPSDKAETPAPAKPEEIAAKAGPAATVEPSSKVESVTKTEAAPATQVEPPKESAATAKAPEKESKQVLPVITPAAEVAAVGAVGAAAVLAEAKARKTVLPPTRIERAKKRRLREIVLFWILVPVVAVALYVGILYFGRDTRVEGQVIPPTGMTLSDEVWIVSDFSSLAAGVADDVAKERVPLQLAIQEAQDHVQRVQADIASREERIRLIREEVQSAKDDMNGMIKKSQSDAQALYDGEGKDLDDQYASKIAGLKQAIADRAASLKLQYQPDPAFPSPEVWANAYRLALYQTPTGVDGTKEHQWIADQLKQWRDFEKSMDDHYQQLRDQAAQMKQEIAPKLTDLNSKVDDLNQRIDGTQTEEEPLKAELKQAQTDLAAAQDAEANLDEKYYGQLYSLPAENISYHISVRPNGRFTWVPDNPFGEGEVEHNYVLFSRAIRADGRQYWALHEFSMKKNETSEVTLEPGGFLSTKAILRPNLPPDEIEQ